MRERESVRRLIWAVGLWALFPRFTGSTFVCQEVKSLGGYRVMRADVTIPCSGPEYDILYNYKSTIYVAAKKIQKMSVKITKRTNRKITMEIEIELDSKSMLNSEENILKTLNAAGNEATKIALKQFDTNGNRIQISNKNWSSKVKKKKEI